MSKLNKEDLWDECALAFNSALQRAHDLYPYRWKRINQAREQIKELIFSIEEEQREDYLRGKRKWRG